MRLPWAGRQLSDDDEFQGVVRFACMQLGLSVLRYDGEHVQVRGRRLSGLVGLDDVRARCDLLPRARWPEVVLDALQTLALAREAQTARWAAGPDDALLRARVQSEGSVLADDVVARPLCPGLVEVLLVDEQGALAQVPSAVAGGWGVPFEVLLQRGRAQALALEQPTVEALDLGVEGVVAVQTSSPFAGSQVLRLAELVDVPAAGALVALPTRHLLLAAPLRTRAQALDAAQALLANAEQLWEQGPGPLSPDLFWLCGGDLVHLPGTPTSLSPPLAFVELLDALP